MEVGEKECCQVNHFCTARYNASFPAKASEPVALPPVVIFNSPSFFFRLCQHSPVDDFCETPPTVGEEMIYI